METEFYGGEQTDEPENDEVGAETWRPMFSLSHDGLTAILSRQSEIASDSKKRQKERSRDANEDLRRLLSHSAGHACSSLQREATKNAAFVCTSALDQLRFATPRCDPNGNEECSKRLRNEH